jgi:Domain of unknown function (DUF4430)
VTPGRGLATGAVVSLAAALAGCGFGPGPSSAGTATLTVTRDYGSKTLLDATDNDPAASDTVIRLLDREAQLATRYGGRFVQSIDGLAGEERDGRRYDWFFYVNGTESPVGAADVRVRGGDRIWWDYRDWTDAMSVPAVVGSWPQPFVHTSGGGNGEPVIVDCRAGGVACATASSRLADAGVHARIERGGSSSAHEAGALRVLVGPWRRIRADGAVDGLRGGPQENGVFATFKGPTNGAFRLVALDPTAAPARDLGPGAGLVAALRAGNEPPTWIVTGSSTGAVRRAARLLNQRDLGGRYAVAAPPRGGPLGLPVEPSR